MTDAVLIDVIRRKNADPKVKVSGPKWQRTKRIVQWLIARLPKTAQVSAVAFNSSIKELGGAGWKSAQDQAAIGAILSDLETIVPSRATNLHVGLKRAAQLKPTDIYLITDGLPTAGNSSYKSLSPFASCSALWGSRRLWCSNRPRSQKLQTKRCAQAGSNAAPSHDSIASSYGITRAYSPCCSNNPNSRVRRNMVIKNMAPRAM